MADPRKACGRGKGEKSKSHGSTEITVGSQVCLATAPLYQVNFCPDKSITSYAMLDFKNDIESL